MIRLICLPLVLCFCTIHTVFAGVDASRNETYLLSKSNEAAALMGQFNFKDAYHKYSELARLYPKNNDLLVNQAIALLNRQLKEDEEKALAILQGVLKSEPKHLRAQYCSSLLLLHMGNLEAALAGFQSVLKSQKDDPDLYYFTGKTFQQLGKPEKALYYFQLAIQKDPYLTSGYYGSIMALRLLGEKGKAKDMIAGYRKIKDNPRSRVTEFKYTKMGALATVSTHDSKGLKVKRPPGPLFLPLESIKVEKGAEFFDSFHDAGDITIADINSDGIPDIFIPDVNGNNLILIGKKEAYSYDVDRKHPFAQITKINSILWGDINDDGLLDGYILRDGKNQLWYQDKNNKWVNSTQQSQTAGDALNTVSGALFDADHDGDLDIYCVNENGPNELFNNNRNTTFRKLAEEKNIASGEKSKAILIHDLDNDRDGDLLVINQKTPHNIYINDLLWNYTDSPEFKEFSHSDITALTVGDIDSNGKREIYTASTVGRLVKWQLSDSGDWQQTPLLHSSGKNTPGNSKLSLCDFDGDTNLELLFISGRSIKIINPEDLSLLFEHTSASPLFTATTFSTPQGPALLLKEQNQKLQVLKPGTGRYNFAQVKLMGRKEREANLRTNSSGIGTIVSARIGANWTSLDTFYNDLNSGQSDQPLTIGLGGAPFIDFIQIEWPDGVFQTEIALKPNTLHSVAETQRQMSSCPVLFAWNGKKFEFVSDLLGVGGIGYSIGPGVYAESRPWEFFLLPENFNHPHEGKIKLKMTEPMEEVEYLDAVSMHVYDLPPSWQMGLDERMGILGPQPTGKPFFYKNTLFPVKAVNDRGEDVLPLIRLADLEAAPVGKLDRRFIGMLENFHTLTLSFDKPLSSQKGAPVLVADGWVEYPYSQTSFAAWQAGAEYIAPTLEIKDKNGNWKPYLEQFGYPAGMPRQMSLPLDGLPEGVMEIRISTNQEIYWDRIFIAYSERCPDVKTKRLPLHSARLDAIGFPKRIDFPQRRPYYDFSEKDTNWGTRFLEGDYTKLGNVFELVAKNDSALAIIGPGEGIHLEFLAPNDYPQAGWKRRYVLHSQGWCKDMDLYTNTGNSVAPLPGSPDLPEVKKLHQKYNTRYLIGKRW